MEDDGVLAQLIRMRLPFGQSYGYCPRGPIGDLALFEKKQMEWATEGTHDMLFVRFEPSSFPSRSRFIKPVRSIQPKETLLLDLKKSSDELLTAMHPKTRYNIRLAEKKGLRIEFIQGDEIMDRVWPLFETTSSRGEFRLHPKSYYQKMLAQLQGDCRAFCAVASLGQEPLAANLMIDFGNTRTYLHGASSGAHRPLMAPFLLHWSLIQEAKGQGLEWYDWWGVAPLQAPEDHPWAGISRFKRGFGGEEVAYPGTYDLVLKPFRYHGYTTVRHLVDRFRRR